MSSSTSEPVIIRILDREYTVGCEPGERDSLSAAADLAHARIQQARGGNRVAALDRVAVLAALNLANELQQLRDETERRDRELRRTLDGVEQRLDALLDSAT